MESERETIRRLIDQTHEAIHNCRALARQLQERLDAFDRTAEVSLDLRAALNGAMLEYHRDAEARQAAGDPADGDDGNISVPISNPPESKTGA